MADYHKNQIEAMKNAGMNNLLFETISTTKEAQAICAALDGHSDVQAVVSFTCRQVRVRRILATFEQVAVQYSTFFRTVCLFVMENHSRMR